MTTKNPKTLIVDMSPLFYSNLISVTNQMKKTGLKPDPETGKIPFTYRNELIFIIMEEIKELRKFGTPEIVLAFDNSIGGYWRKHEYSRYKYKRTKEREESEIDWDSAFKVFEELKTLLKEYTSFKVIDIPTLEADDIAFVLSEYLQDTGVILQTLDGDWKHALNYNNVKLFMTRKTQKKDGHYVELTKEELKEKKLEHCISGDPGDGFLHIKAWTQFSDEFLKEYPKFKGKEIQLYDKHHEIEHKYNLKHNYDPKKQAYKHPRFGYKMLLRSKKSLRSILKENPIHLKNFKLNRQLCLPTNVPTELKEKIIYEYEQAKTQKDPAELQKFFMNNNLFELTGIIGLL